MDLPPPMRRHGDAYCAQHSLPVHQLKVMRALQLCRTAALGGDIERCGHCDHQRISYNSCRNRHYVARAQWPNSNQGRSGKPQLLPIPYFHVVFTIPEQLNPLALQNKKVFYGLLFAAAADGYVRMSFRAGPIRSGVIANRSERQGCIHHWNMALVGSSDHNPLPASPSIPSTG